MDPVFREATPDDADALLELERAANLVALAHVFPPTLYPYPSTDVVTRWRALLVDEAVAVHVLDHPAGSPHLLALVAFDSHRIRHLAVHPDHWGRGLARHALDLAIAQMVAPTLWVLEDNHRARGLYEHLGWRPTGRQQPAEFPPHPLEVELSLRR